MPESNTSALILGFWSPWRFTTRKLRETRHGFKDGLRIWLPIRRHMQQRLVNHQWEHFSDKVRIDQSPFVVLFLMPGIRKEDQNL